MESESVKNRLKLSMNNTTGETMGVGVVSGANEFTPDCCLIFSYVRANRQIMIHKTQHT
jgi:hypothetical protein